MGRAKTAKDHNHTFQFLAKCKNPNLTKLILSKADKDVIKGICNAAYNVTQGDIPLSRRQKKYFAHHRKVLAELVKKESLVKKTKKIQKGGAFPAILAAILPQLLGAVLSTVGTAVFNRQQ